MILNCVVTDDEPIAIEIVEDYIKMVPSLHLQATCHDAIETFSALHKGNVDVLFIDIQMPEVNGLDFIRSLKKAPMVVFTTAYPNYALDGYELDAVDYLLKPISIERFFKTVDKLFARAATQQNIAPPAPQTNGNILTAKNYFFIKSNTGYIRVPFDKILHIEGLENYIKIVCDDRTILSLNTMKYAETILPPERFLRIHRSCIINLDRVDSFKDNTFKLKDKQWVVGKSYRKVVTDFLKSHCMD